MVYTIPTLGILYTIQRYTIYPYRVSIYHSHFLLYNEGKIFLKISRKSIDIYSTSCMMIITNASCEKLREVHKALDSGLPATIVVKKMTENTKVINGVKYIKCPNQVTKGKIQCRECKLCMKGNRKEVVVFEWHSRVKPPKVVMESL